MSNRAYYVMLNGMQLPVRVEADTNPEIVQGSMTRSSSLEFKRGGEVVGSFNPSQIAGWWFNGQALASDPVNPLVSPGS